MDNIELSVFASRIDAVCEEMGVILRRSAFSPNIKDRLDFSCALFDEQGGLCAQAAHIPVHLGSMAFAMAGLVDRFSWEPGDMVVFNDPFLGGTHLPDVTLVAPVFIDQVLAGFVANRAHHANIGASVPGSMPLSTRLEDEGLVIAPQKIQHRGKPDRALLTQIRSALGGVEGDDLVLGDFYAQISANSVGVERVQQVVNGYGLALFQRGLNDLNRYADALIQPLLASTPNGRYRFSDVLDGDGVGATDLPIALSLEVTDEGFYLDFTGTARQVAGNVNCPMSVTAAAAYYVFRCLMPSQTPSCAGAFQRIHLHAPEGCLVHAQGPAAVASGNVETSSRIVDVILGALAQALPERIPAASQGTMNNVAMGGRGERVWDYYETLAGGLGGHARHPGLHARHSHMTNTLNTSIEVLESHYPLRVMSYQVRRGSGGAGHHAGGDGVVREYQLTAPADVTLLTERRSHAPYGLCGGQPGLAGRNTLNGKAVPAKTHIRAAAGDRLRIETPGGGGWGK